MLNGNDYYDHNDWVTKRETIMIDGKPENIIVQERKENVMEELEKMVKEEESVKVAEEQLNTAALAAEPTKLAPYDPVDAKGMDVPVGPYADVKERKVDSKTAEKVFAEKLLGDKMDTKPSVEIPFKTFYEELNERFAEFNLSRNSYGEAVVHVKLDILMHLLLKKGIFSFEELVGTINSDNKREGGCIAEYVQEAKKYEYTVR